MRKYLFLGFFLLLGCLLSSCSSVHKNYPMQSSDAYLQETWPHHVNTQPARWLTGADPWFLSGVPNKIERDNRRAPLSAAVSTMLVKTPEFDSVKVNGTFQVQLFGRTDHISVYVFGPNDEIRQVAIQTRKNCIYIYQIPGEKQRLSHVIVRIGIPNLRALTQLGPGLIQGRAIESNGLNITSRGWGDILLSGNMRLRRVHATGHGDVTLFGVFTPDLDIRMTGWGDVNLCGRIGVHHILNIGIGCLNMVGAETGSLAINTANGGGIAIVGHVGLGMVNASDVSGVYLYYVNSPRLTVNAWDNARVGLAGSAHNLNVLLKNAARFEGRYLHSQNVTVRTDDESHANVYASNRAFASAMKNSSIYFFGPPDILSEYESGNGTVIPVWKSFPPNQESPWIKR